MRRMVLVLALLLLPAISWSADEYVLVMSKEDNVCQHMLGLYNEDLRKFGEVRYDEHEEFNWIKWEEKTINLRPPSIPQTIMEKKGRLALFDINNDSKNEAIIYTQGMLFGNQTDDYDIFRYDDLAMLNEVIEGTKYYAKVLKSFSSADGVPINVYDLSEKDIKKLPERMKYYLAKTKERGDKDVYFVGAGNKITGNKINFLKFKNRFYIAFEGPRGIGPDEDWSKVEQYSIISELQKDNTLKNQCLYLIKKDKTTNRRTN